jgi:tetratricopeptide (TPR) repeat protein
MNYSAFEMDRGDMAAALAIADIGVAAAPKRFEVRANRSLALGALGRLEEALADARICVAVAPKDPFPHYVHGVALYRLGRLDEARRAFTEALVREGTLALRPTFAALAALGRREEGCAAWVEIEATGQATAGLHKSAVNLGCVQR